MIPTSWNRRACYPSRWASASSFARKRPKASLCRGPGRLSPWVAVHPAWTTWRATRGLSGVPSRRPWMPSPVRYALFLPRHSSSSSSSHHSHGRPRPATHRCVHYPNRRCPSRPDRRRANRSTGLPNANGRDGSKSWLLPESQSSRCRSQGLARSGVPICKTRRSCCWRSRISRQVQKDRVNYHVLWASVSQPHRATSNVSEIWERSSRCSAVRIEGEPPFLSVAFGCSAVRSGVGGNTVKRKEESYDHRNEEWPLDARTGEGRLHRV